MAFKVGKKAKSEPINPFRPTFGHPPSRKYTVCRITNTGDKPHLFEIGDGLSVRVDCDPQDLFVNELKFNLPKDDVLYDADLELYRVAEKHLEFIIDRATDYFDEVKVDRNGKVETVRSPTRIDMVNRDGSKFEREKGND